MSFDLDIAPLDPNPVRWSIVMDLWRKRLGEQGSILLGPNPLLRKFGTADLVADGDPLLPGLMGYFELPGRSTLSIGVLGNAGHIDEWEYIDDYNRGLSAKQVRRIADDWRAAGYWIEVSSFGGRPHWEPELMLSLCWALAEATSGVIIVMNDGILRVGVGVYTPDEFAAAQWNVRGDE